MTQYNRDDRSKDNRAQASRDEGRQAQNRPQRDARRDEDEQLAGGRKYLADESGTEPSSQEKRAESDNLSTSPFARSRPGDKAGNSGDLEGVDEGASQRYRERYAEVMGDFRAGTLHRPSDQIVKDISEAKSIAAEQARHCEWCAEQRDSR